MSRALFKKSVFIAAAIAALLSQSCAGVHKPIRPPRIALANIQVQAIRLFEMSFLIEMRVFNPNDTAVEVNGLECDLELNGKPFATGVSDATTEIPSFDTRVIPVTVYSSLAHMVRGAMRMQDADALKYRVTGFIHIRTGAQAPSAFPFESMGELSLRGVEEGGT